jgi:hypothetical protein
MLGVMLAVLGCKTRAPEPASQPPESAPAAEESPPSTGAANPASAHCAAQGGRTEIVDGPRGQSGICIFDDGSRCEEFRFLRGSCKPKSCWNADGVCE